MTVCTHVLFENLFNSIEMVLISFRMKIAFKIRLSVKFCRLLKFVLRNIQFNPKKEHLQMKWLSHLVHWLRRHQCFHHFLMVDMDQHHIAGLLVLYSVAAMP